MRALGHPPIFMVSLMPDLIVRFVTEKGFVSAGIRWVTYSDFSHVELGLPDGTWLGAHASGGVQIRPANYMTPSLERVYALPVSQMYYDLATAYAHAKIGTDYSMGDIARIFFRSRATKSPRGLICSWFVLNVLESAGLFPLNVQPGYNFKVTPDMLHLSPIFLKRQLRKSA